jgi:predicted nucleotidyltransferase
VLDIQSLRGAYCDTYQYLVLAEIREKLQQAGVKQVYIFGSL